MATLAGKAAPFAQAGPLGAEAGASRGTARRRRAQRHRQQGRHVSWLSGLLGHGHHATRSPIMEAFFKLEKEVASLRDELLVLRAQRAGCQPGGEVQSEAQLISNTEFAGAAAAKFSAIFEQTPDLGWHKGTEDKEFDGLH